jgi:hypothetical protein
MPVMLRPSERTLFSSRPRSNLRIHHVALIALLGWMGYLLVIRALI